MGKDPFRLAQWKSDAKWFVLGAHEQAAILEWFDETPCLTVAHARERRDVSTCNFAEQRCPLQYCSNARVETVLKCFQGDELAQPCRKLLGRQHRLHEPNLVDASGENETAKIGQSSIRQHSAAVLRSLGWSVRAVKTLFVHTDIPRKSTRNRPQGGANPHTSQQGV